MSRTFSRVSEITTTGLYVEPCTFCPLECTLCYTRHESQRLLPEPLVERAVALLLSGTETLGIFWCGLGELYADARFPGIVDRLDARWGDRLVHSIQTNGQYPDATPFVRADNKVVLVSVDLPRAFQEQNRGPETYDAAVRYLATQREAGVLGGVVKTLVTQDTVGELAQGFDTLVEDVATVFYDEPEAVAEWLRLEPVLPFRADETAAGPPVSFRANAYSEERDALLKALAHHLPEHAKRLRERPRTVQVALTTNGVFSCCEATVRVAHHDELQRLSYDDLMSRLEEAVAICEDCPLKDVC